MKMLNICRTMFTDWDELKNTLRQADIEEFKVLYPHTTISAHFDDLRLVCCESYTVLDKDGVVVAIFGTQPSDTDNTGIVWMLCSRHLEKYKKEFLKHSQNIRKLCLANYDKIFNVVYSKNLQALRYLKYVKAKFIKEKNIGSFLFFEFNKNQ